MNFNHHFKIKTCWIICSWTIYSLFCTLIVGTSPLRFIVMFSSGFSQFFMSRWKSRDVLSAGFLTCIVPHLRSRDPVESNGAREGWEKSISSWSDMTGKYCRQLPLDNNLPCNLNLLKMDHAVFHCRVRFKLLEKRPQLLNSLNLVVKHCVTSLKTKFPNRAINYFYSMKGKPNHLHWLHIE